MIFFLNLFFFFKNWNIWFLTKEYWCLGEKVLHFEWKSSILNSNDEHALCTLAFMHKTWKMLKILKSVRFILSTFFFFFGYGCGTENDATVHDMRVDHMEPEDDLDEDEPEDEPDEKLLDDRKLRKRSHQFFCDDQGDSSAPENDDDLEDAEGPENLCIKNTRDSNNDGVGNNNNNKDNNTSSNSNSNNNNRIGLGEWARKRCVSKRKLFL